MKNGFLSIWLGQGMAKKKHYSVHLWECFWTRLTFKQVDQVFSPQCVWVSVNQVKDWMEKESKPDHLWVGGNSFTWLLLICGWFFLPLSSSIGSSWVFSLTTTRLELPHCLFWFSRLQTYTETVPLVLLGFQFDILPCRSWGMCMCVCMSENTQKFLVLFLWRMLMDNCLRFSSFSIQNFIFIITLIWENILYV